MQEKGLKIRCKSRESAMILMELLADKGYTTIGDHKPAVRDSWQFPLVFWVTKNRVWPIGYKNAQIEADKDFEDMEEYTNAIKAMHQLRAVG